MGTDSDFTDILMERQEHILRIKINRPQKKNALTTAITPASCHTVLRPLVARSVRCEVRGLEGVFWWAAAGRLMS